MAKPPTIIDLAWTRDLEFTASAASPNSTIAIDGNSKAGPSPPQLLAYALASCMAVDVVHVLTKGRHTVTILRAHLTGHRAQEDPHRFVRIELQFTIDGAAPGEAVDRAIALSRDKYCSVWHSLRQDIQFDVTWNRP